MVVCRAMVSTHLLLQEQSVVLVVSPSSFPFSGSDDSIHTPATVNSHRLTNLRKFQSI